MLMTIACNLPATTNNKDKWSKEHVQKSYSLARNRCIVLHWVHCMKHLVKPEADRSSLSMSNFHESQAKPDGKQNDLGNEIECLQIGAHFIACRVCSGRSFSNDCRPPLGEHKVKDKHTWKSLANQVLHQP